MNKNNRIYIAGHTGLLGSALLQKIVTEGYSNIITKSHAELDLTNQNAVFKFFNDERPEYVFLAAGLTGGILVNDTYPANFFHQNISIQDNVFESASKFGVKNLIFYGSSCMYPKDCKQPIKEEFFLTGEIEPTSEAYALAKMAGIIACKSYNRQFKTDKFIALVPNSMFGPKDNFNPENSHVVSSLIRKIHEAKQSGEDSIKLWGSGEVRREFIYVDDVADASIFAMNNVERLENHHYNIGTGDDYTIKALALLIANVIDYKGEISWDTNKPDGPAKKLLESSKFFALGWKPKVSIKAGLQKTYEWFLQGVK